MTAAAQAIDSTAFRDWHRAFVGHFEQRLNQTLQHQLANSPPRLAAAIRHATLDGGKRLRPALILLAFSLEREAGMQMPDPTGPGFEPIWPAAFAIELIHVYSLIHDDLPAMDNDDLRRGKPTVHRAFDEATAILAGDALQAMAFGQLAQLQLPAEARLRMIEILANAAGPAGMVGGQQIDLESVRQALNETDLRHMHELKTGALIRAALLLGGTAAQAPADQLDRLDRFGHMLGLAFQIQDDILDVTGIAEQLGKTPGKDAAQQKNSFVSQLGLSGARQALDQSVDNALSALTPLTQRGEPLRACTHFVMTRRS